ncbi:MAG: hypothetical protein I3273_02390 [Candidatus Moeniiplasma glomeromycotorum]|nr:hypothetical protein [Candidatus Moeniiplasma glomeromycotorum]MCE8167034.1 hypothetical protein [Candidatus Moeniiplasma glomeromycotorum]MCE8168954.1 hypothetical protein [Candidatus Moeniiplasma glomeromycotorum]
MLKIHLNSKSPIKANNETNGPEINSLPKFEATKKEIIKIKRINDDLYCLKSEWEGKNGGGSSEAYFSEKNFSAILKERGESGWKKEILINWKSELKDGLWLVKKKEEIIGQPGSFFYSTHYENDDRE